VEYWHVIENYVVSMDGRLLTAILTCCCWEVGDDHVLAGLFVVDLRLVTVTAATAATAALSLLLAAKESSLILVNREAMTCDWDDVDMPIP